MIMPGVLWFAGPRLVKVPPQGSVIPDVFRVLGIWLRGGKRENGVSRWDLAKPSYIRERDGFVDESAIHWDDKFVDEIRQTLKACGVFAFIPIFQLADIGSVGLGNLGNDMSVAMTLNGVPNDLINNCTLGSCVALRRQRCAAVASCST
jgi:POT family proton-dependent oligopeptide transporter